MSLEEEWTVLGGGKMFGDFCREEARAQGADSVNIIVMKSIYLHSDNFLILAW